MAPLLFLTFYYYLAASTPLHTTILSSCYVCLRLPSSPTNPYTPKPPAHTIICLVYLSCSCCPAAACPHHPLPSSPTPAAAHVPSHPVPVLLHPPNSPRSQKIIKKLCASSSFPHFLCSPPTTFHHELVLACTGAIRAWGGRRRSYPHAGAPPLRSSPPPCSFDGVHAMTTNVRVV